MSFEEDTIPDPIDPKEAGIRRIEEAIGAEVPRESTCRRAATIRGSMGCPKCEKAFLPFMQETAEGASPRILLLCTNCGMGMRLLVQRLTICSVDPKYLEGHGNDN